MKTLILIKIIYKITNKHKIVFSYTIAGTRFDNFGFLTILDKKIRNRTEVTGVRTFSATVFAIAFYIRVRFRRSRHLCAIFGKVAVF